MTIPAFFSIMAPNSKFTSVAQRAARDKMMLPAVISCHDGHHAAIVRTYGRYLQLLLIMYHVVLSPSNISSIISNRRLYSSSKQHGNN